MNIEEFKDITIAYMRRTGRYGPQNQAFMEYFKAYLKENNLLNNRSTILGIALDNPENTAADNLRYDVGLVIDINQTTALSMRKIPDGKYAIFEVSHTVQAVTAFWNNIQQLTDNLLVDETKPIIERYSAEKIANHLCEFCIPIKDSIEKGVVAITRCFAGGAVYENGLYNTANEKE